MLGYLYILTNEHMPGLVKIGYTDRDPFIRANELSSHTGVPGQFEVEKYWLVNDAYNVESLIHSKLHSHRTTGEFFKLDLEVAISQVSSILISKEIIDADGNSFPAKRISEKEKLKIERATAAEKFKNNRISLLKSITDLYSLLNNLHHYHNNKAKLESTTKGFWGKTTINNDQFNNIYSSGFCKSAAKYLHELNLSPLLKTAPFSQVDFKDDANYVITEKGLFLISEDDYSSILTYQSFRGFYFRRRNTSRGKNLIEIMKSDPKFSAKNTRGEELVLSFGLNMKKPYKIPASTKLVRGKDREITANNYSDLYDHITNIPSHSPINCQSPLVYDVIVNTSDLSLEVIT